MGRRLYGRARGALLQEPNQVAICPVGARLARDRVIDRAPGLLLTGCRLCGRARGALLQGFGGGYDVVVAGEHEEGRAGQRGECVGAHHAV